LIKQKYINAHILISPNWQVEFHVHTNASLLVVGVMLFQILIGKSDQLVVYASRLLNRAEHNYSTTEREALITIFSFHKFRHYLLGNKFVFYVDHMALVYLVNKPHVSRRIVRWLLLFFKYDLAIIYKLGITHVVDNRVD
jgi:hypothetical protein